MKVIKSLLKIKFEQHPFQILLLGLKDNFLYHCDIIQNESALNKDALRRGNYGIKNPSKFVCKHFRDDLVRTVHQIDWSIIVDRLWIIFLGNKNKPRVIEAMQLEISIKEAGEEVENVRLNSLPKTLVEEERKPVRTRRPITVHAEYCSLNFLFREG